MPQPSTEQHQAFLNYWREQFNVHDVFVRISAGPKGYIGWAANRTNLETSMRTVGAKNQIEYEDMPAYPMWFTPAFGKTPVEAAQEAVRLYEIDLNDPEARIRMNVGCLAIAEMLSNNSE